MKIDLIDVNPADKVERPKKDRYVGSFYDADEVNALFEAAKGSKLELPILFGVFYGLRRSEAFLNYILQSCILRQMERILAQRKAPAVRVFFMDGNRAYLMVI